MPPVAPISAIVFDLDNTLFNRQRAFARWCFRWAQQAMPDCNQALRRRLLRHAIELDNWGVAPEAAVKFLAAATGGNSSQLWQSFRRDLAGHVRSDARVTRMLRWIQTRPLMIAIGSNGSSESQRSKMSAANLACHQWSEVVISGEVSLAKPEPAFYLQLQERLQLEPNEILMVGDDWWRDVQAPAACGWRTCWVAAGRSIPKPSATSANAAPQSFPDNAVGRHAIGPTVVVNHVDELRTRHSILSAVGFVS